MAQQLLSAVIHKLDKIAGAPAHIVEAAACLDVGDAPLISLVGQVQEVYTKREGKSYGKFDPELTAASAEPHLLLLRDNGADFLAQSKSLMQVLKGHSDAQNFSTGGHVLMFELLSNGSRWFVVVILNSAAGTMIDDALRVVQAPHLDVDGIRFAGRVNFSDWSAGTERYISFLRGKNNEVSRYFQRFLGCSTVQQDLNDTRNLVKTVKKFAVDQGLNDEQREKLLAEVNQIAVQQAKDRQPLDLSTLANRVWPTAPETLKAAFASADPPIADGFVPQKRGLIGLVRFTAKASKWKLEFEREAVQDRTIEFDPGEQTLTIKNLPPEVIASLQQEFSSDAEEVDPAN